MNYVYVLTKLTVNHSHTVKTEQTIFDLPADHVYATLLQTESHWKTAQQNWSQLRRKVTKGWNT